MLANVHAICIHCCRPQTLANVIDASGSIYAAKVDHLLQDAIKVRTDLTRANTGSNPQAADDEGEGDAPARKAKGVWWLAPFLAIGHRLPALNASPPHSVRV